MILPDLVLELLGRVDPSAQPRLFHEHEPGGEVSVLVGEPVGALAHVVVELVLVHALPQDSPAALPGEPADVVLLDLPVPAHARAEEGEGVLQ